MARKGSMHHQYTAQINGWLGKQQQLSKEPFTAIIYCAKCLQVPALTKSFFSNCCVQRACTSSLLCFPFSRKVLAVLFCKTWNLCTSIPPREPSWNGKNPFQARKSTKLRLKLKAAEFTSPPYSTIYRLWYFRMVTTANFTQKGITYPWLEVRTVKLMASSWQMEV